MTKSDVVEKFFKIKGEPLNLYPYQKKWIDDSSRFRILNKSRQVGMSYALAAESLVDAMLNEDHLTLIVSTGDRASKNVMSYIWSLYHSMDRSIYKRLKLIEKSKTGLQFTHNNSKIMSLPSNPAGVRGFKADHVKLDEFAFFEHEDLMWEAVTPMVSRGGKISIVSTPFGKLNRFHKIFEEDRGAIDDVWSRHKVHYSECPDLDIKSIRKTMAETQFLQEYCCQFIDSSVSAIPMDLILKCIDEDLRMRTGFEDKKGEGVRIIGGVDFGKVEDRTAVTLFEEKETSNGRLYTQIYLCTMKGDFGKQLDHIKRLIDLFKVDDLWVDMTGMGEKLTEDLIKHSTCVHGVIFTRKNKERMVADIVAVMQAGGIKLLKDDDQVKEFHSLKREVTPHNNVVFRHQGGSHDDIFWSVSLAISNAIRIRHGGFAFGSFTSI